MSYSRKHGSKRDGSSFSQIEINAVWQKAPKDYLQDSSGDTWRRDRCGALIKRDRYGDVSSIYGWEVDHDKPVASGGRDELSNLQPLQWENNRHKSDDYPYWTCKNRN